jgi:hypothetical protein
MLQDGWVEPKNTSGEVFAETKNNDLPNSLIGCHFQKISLSNRLRFIEECLDIPYRAWPSRVKNRSRDLLPDPAHCVRLWREDIRQNQELLSGIRPAVSVRVVEFFR